MVIKDLLLESYQPLVSFADGIYTTAFGEGKPLLQMAPDTWSVWSLLPSKPEHARQGKPEVTDEDQQFSKMRWGFFGLAAVTLVSYVIIVAHQYEDVLQDIVSQYQANIKNSEGEGDIENVNVA